MAAALGAWIPPALAQPAPHPTSASIVEPAPPPPAPAPSTQAKSAGETLVAAPSPAPATQPKPPGEAPKKDAKPEGKPGPSEDRLVVTRHEITVNGQPLKYQATAGALAMKDEAGKPRANVFFVAYRKEPGPDFDPAARPITFCFNGGPGAAAVWLHLGAVGPRKVALGDEGESLGPPYRLADNPHTWLDATDLVFIDPVGTGYSRPAEGVKGEEFYGVEPDVRSVGEFIRLYLTRNERWASPKFLAGESYGTTRAAALSEYLLERLGIELNGIVFVSTVLDFQTLSPGRNNDVPYALFLPTYAASAFYHKKLEADLLKDLPKTLAEVQQFASADYPAALARGDDLKGDARAELVRRLARYTALPADYIDRANLRVSPGAFRKRLLFAERKLVGRFDSRLTGDDPDPASDRVEYDAGFPEYFAQYTASFTDYARRALKYESDLSYEVLTDRVQPWSFGRDGGHGYLDVAGALKSAVVKSPRLKLLFASGYFDLATPYFSTEYTLAHMGLTPEQRRRVTRTYYLGGHMMYHQKDALEKLKRDASEFIRGAAQGGGKSSSGSGD